MILMELYVQDICKIKNLIPDCNIDVGKFWTEVTQYSKENKIDPTLSYICYL